MTDQQSQYFSKTLEKGLIILDLFDRDHQHRSLSEISRLTGINKTSTYRLVNTLVQMGYLRKSTKNKSLRLGPRAFVLGHHFFHGFDIFQSVKPIIDKTFLEQKISIDSALLHGRTLISLYRREMPNLIYFRLPLIMDELYARAMGKAILANLDPAELFDILENTALTKHTPNTRSDREEILKEIESTRTRGYSINNEEYVEGLICIGAPLMNLRERTVVGAVSLDFPTSEYSLDAIVRNYPRVLTKLASELSETVTAADI
ncbi:MAG: IclR family transcriptional regulator [Deltaproteobacteria bacterium]|jgi:IclR family pca regulon transcriptional regulator|nr:IclR family transcriptional regulator [Deltaproteobacteria bacterium]